MAKFLASPPIVILLTIALIYWVWYAVHTLMLVVIRQPHRFTGGLHDEYELWLMIPAFNEELVIERTVRSLCQQMERLPDKIVGHVLVIDDMSSDDTYAHACASGQACILQTGEDSCHQGKGAVLDVGRQWLIDRYKNSENIDSNHIIVGVIDADGFMFAEDLTNIVRYFDEDNKEETPEIGMVQSVVRMKNSTGFLKSSQEWDFAWSGRKQQLIRMMYGDTIASGNGQFMNMSLLQEVLWGNGLLEDMEYTFRSWLKGYSTVFANDAMVWQEAVTSVKAYVRQRTRWCQGGLQCIHYLPQLYKCQTVTKVQIVSLTLFLIAPLFSVFTVFVNYSAFILQILICLTYKRAEGILFLMLIWALLLACSCFSQCRYLRAMGQKVHVLRVIESCLAFQVINWTVGSVLAPNAVRRQVMGRDNWVKTVHNLGA